MFNYSEYSFRFFFDSACEIRRARSVQALRLKVSARTDYGQAARFAISRAGERAFPLQLGLVGEQAGVFALRLGLCDVSRLAWRLVLAENARSSAAAALIVSGALETGACVVLRVRLQERFTN